MLINLFLIMLSAGMPELKKEADIFALEGALHINPNLTDRMAEKLFKEKIQLSVTATSRRMDNMFHNFV
jgi:hypothetical protein